MLVSRARDLTNRLFPQTHVLDELGDDEDTLAGLVEEIYERLRAFRSNYANGLWAELQENASGPPRIKHRPSPLRLGSKNKENNVRFQSLFLATTLNPLKICLIFSSSKNNHHAHKHHYREYL